MGLCKGGLTRRSRGSYLSAYYIVRHIADPIHNRIGTFQNNKLGSLVASQEGNKGFGIINVCMPCPHHNGGLISAAVGGNEFMHEGIVAHSCSTRLHAFVKHCLEFRGSSHVLIIFGQSSNYCIQRIIPILRNFLSIQKITEILTVAFRHSLDPCVISHIRIHFRNKLVAFFIAPIISNKLYACFSGLLRKRNKAFYLFIVPSGLLLKSGFEVCGRNFPR